MLIVASLIVMLNIFLSVVGLVSRHQRTDWEKKQIVYLPFYLAGIGIVCGIVFCVPTVACAMDGEWMFAFFGATVLVCDCMIAAYINCVIWYDDEGFLARNFFGIKHRCKYSEVEWLRSGKDRKIYFRRRSVFIDEISCGGDEFVEAVDTGYKRATGKWVPASSPFGKGWDPMNGHMVHPWGYFLLWVAIGLCCAALPVLTFFSMTAETEPEDVVIRNVAFCSYEIKEDTLLLYMQGEDVPYEISYFGEYGSALHAAELLCNGEVYSVGVEGKHRYVKSLTGSDGTKHITLEMERQVYRNSQKVASWILCILSVIGMCFCYMGIAVARHPERYSKKVQRLFYKDGYLH